MSPYEVISFSEAVQGSRYPGRGIVAGESRDGSKAVIAYFIMGRSSNSRNRVFAERDGALFTEPFDASKLEDPSLIIYKAVSACGSHLVVTNGDQTDTVCEGFRRGRGFFDSLRARSFEPDAPNFTPRISADIEFCEGGGFTYRISILKSEDAAGTACCRAGFEYSPLPGTGHFIHTYECDGDPLPPFRGEPVAIAVPSDIDAFTEEIWKALDADNRIALYVRYTDAKTGEYESRIINKHSKEE